jgi:hypothetical protein
LQCGQLRVSLLDLNGPESVERLSLIAAGNGVALDVRPLLSATPPLTDGTYAVKVELVDDAGRPYVASDGGNGSTQTDFDLKLPGDCTSTPETPGNAGTSGAGPEIGSAGAGGESGGAGDAGGDSAGGGHAGADSAGGGNAGADSAGGAGTAGSDGGGGGHAGGDSADGGNAGAAGSGRTAGASGL